MTHTFQENDYSDSNIDSWYLLQCIHVWIYMYISQKRVRIYTKIYTHPLYIHIHWVSNTRLSHFKDSLYVISLLQKTNISTVSSVTCNGIMWRTITINFYRKIFERSQKLFSMCTCLSAEKRVSPLLWFVEKDWNKRICLYILAKLSIISFFVSVEHGPKAYLINRCPFKIKIIVF